MSDSRPDATNGIAGKDVILFSPHCDDIAYSLAGRLLSGREPSARCLAVTVFTRSTFAPYSSLASSGDPVRITRLRLEEESRFCRSLALTHVDLGFPEAPLRGYDLERDLFSTLPRVEADPIQAEIERSARELHELYLPVRVYSPLGIAGHVDHILVRQAIESTFFGICPILYYEDLPYVGELNDEEYRQELAKTASGLKAETTPDSWLGRKLELLSGYSSQVAEKDKQSVRDHTIRVGGERIWSRTGSEEVIL